MQALVMLSDLELIFLREVLKMYNDKRLGDIDDKNTIAIKAHLKKEFDEAIKQLRPS